MIKKDRQVPKPRPNILVTATNRTQSVRLIAGKAATSFWAPNLSAAGCGRLSASRKGAASALSQ